MEADLLARARRGDGEAFAELCAPHLRRAYNLALRLAGGPDQAADLCQEALLRAYRSLGRFRGDAAFGTWLLHIVHHGCIDALRARSRRPEVPLDDGVPVPPDPRPGPEEVVLARERQAAVAAALGRLSPAFRAAVVLRDVQGLPYEEAAAIAGVPVGTFKSRLSRARAEMRRALAGSPILDGMLPRGAPGGG